MADVCIYRKPALVEEDRLAEGILTKNINICIFSLAMSWAQTPTPA